MNENTNKEPQTTTAPAEIHEQKKTCKTCLLYEGFRYCCSNDGVKESDFCERYQPNPVIYL